MQGNVRFSIRLYLSGRYRGVDGLPSVFTMRCVVSPRHEEVEKPLHRELRAGGASAVALWRLIYSREWQKDDDHLAKRRAVSLQG